MAATDRALDYRCYSFSAADPLLLIFRCIAFVCYIRKRLNWCDRNAWFILARVMKEYIWLLV